MLKFKKVIFLFSIFIVNSILIQAQSSQLFTEDFENGGTSFILNGSGPGSDIGNNQWIVNDVYTGTPTYPNTMREDSTYSGTIGFAPFSKYLHINDIPSGISNCNYDPTNQSDRFAYMSGGICTLGMDSIHFSFFYLCEGSATAYGKVYYSVDHGPWIQIGASLYNSKYKWKFEDITDPAFKNKGNLRFGFRWENNSGIALNSEAFAIDDIDIVGSYGTVNPVTVSVDSVTPNPVCEGSFISVHYRLSDTLCDGTYNVELSDSTGVFGNSLVSWNLSLFYPQTSGTLTLLLPNYVPAGSCYKMKVSRTSPYPSIEGIASPCFRIKDCPNVITTNKPVVTIDTNAVCIGSDIDIPFYSTGVYTFNTYTAQLSDSNGVFPANPLEVGNVFNSDTYDPNLPPYQPGSVSGKIPPTPEGCNYYLRIVSSNPVAIGSPWGPFCIRKCDGNTNNLQDLHFCVTDCSVSPLGIDTLIGVDINKDSATYGSGNQFTTQMLSMLDFSQIGSNGILGSVSGVNDTTINVHIPCKDSLPNYGIPKGTNYMRVVSTNSSDPDNTLGTLVRVTIGTPRANTELIQSYSYPTFTPQDTFCTNESPVLLFSPYNYFDKSTYEWVCTNSGPTQYLNGGNPFTSPSGANSNSLYLAANFPPAVYKFKVQETSYGCVGDWSPEYTMVILGPPEVPITGPNILCQGDTGHFQVPFANNTYYHWTATDGLIVDTANNVIDASYLNTGSYSLTMNSINICGQTLSHKTIQVKPYPNVHLGNDTTICLNEPITLNAPSGAGYQYTWTSGGTVLGHANPLTVTPTTNSKYIVTVSGPGGCKRNDTLNVLVQTPTSATYADSVCPAGLSPITLSADTTGTYLWSTGQTTQKIVVNDTGTYSVAISHPNEICSRQVTFNVTLDPCPVDISLVLPNVFSPNGDGNNDFFTPITTGAFDKFSIKIYNRWGQLIYESADPYFKWNGNNKQGKPVSDGVYYYVAETSYLDVKNKGITGFFTLIR